MDAKSGYFLSGDVIRSSPFFTVITVFKMATLTDALLPIFPEESWATRVNLDTCRLRVDGQIRFEFRYVWTWKFLNPERKSLGFKIVWIRVDGP